MPVPVEDPQDDIDEVVEFWKKENPELDVTAKAVAMRLRRASQHLERAVRSNLTDSGVDEYWEIEVLMSLLRAPDHRANAGELGRESQVTSGAITNRMGRLESGAGYAETSTPMTVARCRSALRRPASLKPITSLP